MSQTTPPGPAPFATPARTRPPLRRSRTDRKLGGVAGGLAHYFDIDPLLVRIAFVVLTIAAAGTGLLLYVACLAMVPVEGDDSAAQTHPVMVTKIDNTESSSPQVGLSIVTGRPTVNPSAPTGDVPSFAP